MEKDFKNLLKDNSSLLHKSGIVVIDRSDRNPCHDVRRLEGHRRDGNFGNVSAGVLFSEVAYQLKRW